jgi:hypothetical protein
MFYETILKPLVFATELQDGKYYVTMTRNLNETLAKWRGGEGPLWVRDHGFKRVVEVEEDGNKHSLYLMVLLYIGSFGESNVRSSIVGHSVEQDRPQELSEFIQRYANAFCHKEVDWLSAD